MNFCVITVHHKKEDTKTGYKQIITCVINHDPNMVKHLKSFFVQNSDVFKQIMGDRKIIISERKGPNMASLTFAKSSFSSIEKLTNTTQKCGTSRCKTCPLMNLPKINLLNHISVKLDFSLNCMCENCIYLAICKICLHQFYLGQTINMARTRFCGHRDCFKLDNCKYTKSALSLHIYEEHPDHFGNGLQNFDLGIVKCVKPTRLNRMEDYYVYKTKADTVALNRYKVME